MRNSIDKTGIARGFSDASNSYDRWATAQRLIAGRLAGLLPKYHDVRHVLDVGCGTGLLTDLLHQRYKSANILGIDIAAGMVNFCRQKWLSTPTLQFSLADAETLTSDQSYDLIASSCTFQWFSDRDGAIRNMANVLRPGGVLAAATLVAGSLCELADSYQHALGKDMPGLTFVESDTYMRIARESGLSLKLTKTEIVQVFYRNALEALGSFKGMGATLRHAPAHTPCSVSQVRELVRYYDRNYANDTNLVPITYHVLYFVAERNS